MFYSKIKSGARCTRLYVGFMGLVLGYLRTSFLGRIAYQTRTISSGMRTAAETTMTPMKSDRSVAGNDNPTIVVAVSTVATLVSFLATAFRLTVSVTQLASGSLHLRC